MFIVAKQSASKLSRKLTSRFRPSLLTAILIISALCPTLFTTTAAYASDTNCGSDGIVSGGAGSNWYNGNGRNVCNNNNSSSSYCAYYSNAPSGSCTSNSITSGLEWQCVELVNRLYITNRWITSRWAGDGDTLINNLPSNLTAEANGSVSYVNPGDVITFNYGTAGHAAIINTISGSTINIINQNAGAGNLNSSGSISSGSLSGSNATFAMSGWSGFIIQDIVHHPSTIRPTSISYGGNLNVFTVGGGDRHVYTQYWNGSTWSGYSSLGGTVMSNPAVIVGGSALDVFARGVDNQIYTEYWNGSSWSGWSSLGSTTMQGNPTVMHYGSTEIDVYSLGSDGHPYKDTWNGSSWSGWSSLGNYMGSDLTAIQYGSEMDVVARGTDNAVYKDTWNGSSWSGFSSLGGTVFGNPSVLSYSAEGEYDVWFDTAGGDIWKDTWNGSSWNWADMGGSFTGNAYAMQYGNDMEVYGRANDNTVWTRYWSYSGQSWSSWASLGSTQMFSDPFAYQYGSSELDVFGTSTDSKTYKDTWNGSSWGGFSAMN